MKFYNRTLELRELTHLNKKKPSFIVVTGKRRIGKTELIRQFMANKGVYFFVDDKKNEEQLVVEFLDELKSKYKLPEYAQPKNLETFLSLLFDMSKEHSIVAVFDEFQRFMRINPSIINQFQKLWDLKNKDSNLFLIITGSSIGLIKKIFINEQAPMFKRADNILYLKSFSFSQIMEILNDFKIKDFEEQLKVYFLFGGIIYYYKLMDKYDVKSFDDAINLLILRELAPLNREIDDLLIEEFGSSYLAYYEILNALALGKNTKKEMADYVHIAETSLSPYLNDLINLVSLVSYIIPPTEDILKSKKGRYFLTDNFFLFWFKFIFRNKSYYELNNFSIIKDKIKNELSGYFGHRFESVCKEFLLDLAKQKILHFDIVSINPWWGHTRENKARLEIEIDLVALNEQTKDILFVECKWQANVNADKILAELKEKTQYVQWNNEKRKEHFCIIAKSFKKKLDKKECLCFDLKDMEKVFKDAK